MPLTLTYRTYLSRGAWTYAVEEHEGNRVGFVSRGRGYATEAEAVERGKKALSRAVRRYRAPGWRNSAEVRRERGERRSPW